MFCVSCVLHTQNQSYQFLYTSSHCHRLSEIWKCFGNFVQLCVICLCRCRKKMAPWRESPRDKGCLSNCQMDGLVQILKKSNVPRSIIKEYFKNNGRYKVWASTERKSVFSKEVKEDVLRQCVVTKHNVMNYSKSVQSIRYVCGMQNGADI
jgi:hypothetical protein